MSRGKKLVALCDLPFKEGSKSSEEWSNRGKAKISSGQRQSPLLQTETDLPIEIEELEGRKNYPRIEEFVQEVVNTTEDEPSLIKKKTNWFCNRGFSPTSKIENVSEEYTQSRSSGIDKVTEAVEKKIIVHDVVILRGPSGLSEFKSTSTDEDANIYAKEEVSDTSNSVLPEGTLETPLTPEDPFSVLESEGSLYCPSSDENTDSSDSDYEDDRNLKTKTDKGSSYYEISSEVNKSPIVADSRGSPDNNTTTDTPDTVHTKNTYKRKPDYCYFCETAVLNFGRHIVRNHATEIDVIQILSKPVNSKERRHLFNILRRKGNFLADNLACFKPVREGYVPQREKVPCENCLGYFSSKLLYRHKKRCVQDKVASGMREGEKQLNLFIGFRVDRRLKEQVFPHMRADRVSFEAKKDHLICEFGTRYLKTHREKHFIYVTSRKMRELSKMLIEMRKIEPTITTLLSSLRPRYFEIFVEATKRIAKYDSEKDVYSSPTFAMNIVTSLKQCCDIAITFIYTKNVANFTVPAATLEADLKTLVRLFETNWSYEVSSHAANDLSLNKWNKITIVPLASDLRLLRDHLIKLAKESLSILEEALRDTQSLDYNEINQSFNNLVESVYCRVILLNRKRSGELQRMYLHTYTHSSSETQKYEEFTHAVSQPEKILLQSLKRVVIRGKRGRGVPVLFSSDVQEHIKYMLEIRDHFVPKDNPYLFATANSVSHLVGYKILTKHAKRCGAKIPHQ
ncbi:unnamed protein product [Callosobruchus maculatus]|uniref:Uncharacterized protein n=1 Tax=Callosobruchus maculatus TaxID=64391 RepID=A0A653D5Z4_CALMS|nr:unnamed protein product [Callosobruchus maculatus]